ncbi:uracil-DNA glycosylase [bacterium]|nr:uracil-DNA glycosylase [bacterium]MBU0900157.1 uracil-DNA glycosylase [bacterium]MBU1154106.1 uracil-DNA glycosylase [bacterium]MBU1782472.1 uracil-DNA glycosylase [bacterium]
MIVKNPSPEFIQIIRLFKQHLEDIMASQGDILINSKMTCEEENLDETRRGIAGCAKCELFQHRTNIVFGKGNEKAKLLIIGEAPGHEEDIQGEPFVGRAGQLLTRMLKAINIERAEVYITNIVKCRPPNNRNPLPEEIKNCKPYLHKQLEIINPKIILTLGNFAAQALLNTTTGISKLRGKFYLYGQIKLLSIFHPAAILRNPNLKKATWEDLKLLRDEYDQT